MAKQKHTPAGDRRRVGVEIHSQRLQHVRRAARARVSAVAVLGHLHARPGQNHRRSRRNVEGRQARSARSARVDHVGAARLDARDVLAHRLGGAGYLLDALALARQARQQRRRLRLVPLPVHYLPERPVGLPARQIAAAQNAPKQIAV